MLILQRNKEIKCEYFAAQLTIEDFVFSPW